MEELVLEEREGPVRRRDVEPPRQARRGAEGLLVEEIAPPSDRLTERHARRGRVEVTRQGQAPPPRVRAAGQESADQAAVERRPALPDGEDPPRVLPVVGPGEQHVVEPGADETAEERQLGRLEHLEGVEAAAPGDAGREPDARRHRRRQHHAVPAEGNRPDLDQDGARGAEHATGSDEGRRDRRDRRAGWC